MLALIATLALLVTGLAPTAGAQGGRWRLPGDAGQRGFVGEHKLFVVPAYWAGSAPDPLDQDAVASEIASSDSYYSGVSGGRVTVKLGWMSTWQKITLTSTEAKTCDRGAIRDAVRAIVGSAGSRDHLVVYLDHESACDFTDIETLGLTDKGDGFTITNGSLDSDVVNRIISINSGAASTGSLDCVSGSAAVPLSSTCAYRDQSDPWDPTSTHPYGSIGMPMADTLARIGLLSATDYPEVPDGENTTETIAPLTATSGQRGFWFDDDGYRYHVDYHVPSGQDAWIDDHTWVDGGTTFADPGGGVIVHRQLLGTDLGDRELLDFHPDTVRSDTQRHPGLEPGETYTAPGNAWSIQVRAATATSATVDLSFPVLSKVIRWSGADRFATSAAISAKNYAPGVSVAYIASGRVYTDALSGAPVAGRNGGPVLLVDTEAIPEVVRTELRRLTPAHIVILGGPATISTGVESQLAAYTSGVVERWSGADRFATSAAISAQTYSPGVGTAFIASGRVFTDALSGAPVAGKLGGPVLLVDTNSLPSVIAAELRRLRPGRVVVLGGPATISDAVFNELKTFARQAERWSGDDRFTTSVAITHKSYAPGVGTLYVASGRVYTDALSGAPVAGMTKGPVLLVDTTSIPSAVAAEITYLKPGRIVILGGPATVSTGVQAQLATYLP
ncbi:MAG: cell wall-binding repeat-containing protein [Dermatophilaceae bacterium]